MADDGSAQGTTWPLPKFYFSVKVDTDLAGATFQEVTGLEMEAQVIEYRHGNSPDFSTIKMPGIKKYGDVTLKKGVFAKDNKFFAWFNKIKLNTIQRQSVTISLLDESGNPTMVWTLKNAWPSKITAPDLKSDGNEVAVETLVITHEGLTIANG
ncbi:MAG: phage tail protein [Dysgonamonadaceae bacterium]|jgi:phage tail-like protein|nr:phage tail protein [Dysgonamonadaceae bacterium]